MQNVISENRCKRNSRIGGESPVADRPDDQPCPAHYVILGNWADLPVRGSLGPDGSGYVSSRLMALIMIFV